MRRARTFIAAITLGLFTFFLNLGIEFGRCVENCSLCGAKSTVHHFELYGIGGDYGRRVQVGPVSRLMQEFMGSTCGHRWELYDGHFGSLFSRSAGWGRGVTRNIWVTNLEVFPSSQIVLREHAATDPSLLSRLSEVVRQPNGDDETPVAFVSGLMREMMDRGEEMADPID